MKALYIPTMGNSLMRILVYTFLETDIMIQILEGFTKYMLIQASDKTSDA